MPFDRLFTLFFILSLFFISGCVHQKKTIQKFVVSQKAVTGKNTFNSIQAAIDAIPENSETPYRIFVRTGQYYEKVTLKKPNVELIGEGKNKTRIYFDAYAGQTYANGKTWGTPGSATLTIHATNIRIENITIENSFDFLTNDVLANEDPKRVANAQAVALFLESPSDKVLVRNVNLLGYQDTLFVNSGRSWFDNTLIAGNVDFIFGNGNALFTNSEIKTLARGKLNFPYGYLVAPSTKLSQQYGLTFINCRLTRDSSVPDNSVPLGRPWHPTTQFSDGRYADPNAIGKAVFINSWMDKHITIDGWYAMNGTAKNGTKIPFYSEDSRFFEYNSSGPGAQINYKRPQLNSEETKEYTQKKILGDWKIE
ncbi:MAG: pectin esterase [Cellvibrio sp.]|nr:pectin esterase [Cellvibrio sp.]